jgi:hypothetical protein
MTATPARLRSADRQRSVALPCGAAPRRRELRHLIERSGSPRRRLGPDDGGSGQRPRADSLGNATIRTTAGTGRRESMHNAPSPAAAICSGSGTSRSPTTIFTTGT